MTIIKIIYTILVTWLFFSCSNKTPIDKQQQNVNKKAESSESNISLKDSNSTNDSISDQKPSITFDGNLYHKNQLIHSANVRNSHYQLFAGLVIPDTTKSYTWSTSSLSVFKNGEKQRELYKEDLILSLAELQDFSTCEINATLLYGDETKQVIRIDMGQYPTAPGDETISLIQFEEKQVKYSKTHTIIGRFINKNNGINGMAWTGYFGAELPLKITEINNELTLQIDSSNLHQENEHYYLNIHEGVKAPTNSSELLIVDNPFSSNPKSLKVKLTSKTKVTLIQVAVDQVDIWDYLYKINWVKIKIGDKEGWIKDHKDLEKIGCQAAG